MNDATPPSANAATPTPVKDHDEFTLVGDAARAQLRRVRFQFYGTAVVAIIALVLSFFVWHRTLGQLFWIGLAVVALGLAGRIWRQNLMAYTYSETSGKEPTFTGKRPWVPRRLAVPILLVVGILLILAGTSTGPGRVLARTFVLVFGVLQTLYEAGKNVWGLIWAPVVIGVILLVVAASICMTGLGLFSLILFVFRGFRRDPVEGTGFGFLIFGLALLAVEAFVAWAFARNPELMMNEFFAPFRTIVGWFT
jgi:hypothetical protein